MFQKMLGLSFYIDNFLGLLFLYDLSRGFFNTRMLNK
jgi:hypothetical protein